MVGVGQLDGRLVADVVVPVGEETWVHAEESLVHALGSNAGVGEGVLRPGACLVADAGHEWDLVGGQWCVMGEHDVGVTAFDDALHIVVSDGFLGPPVVASGAVVEVDRGCATEGDEEATLEFEPVAARQDRDVLREV